METIAVVEELDRHGDVVCRRMVSRLPTRVGRGYAADIMVDDPYVAALHLEIRLDADGALEVADMGSLNGSWHSGGASRLDAGTPTPVHGDDVLRIGNTPLRIRLPVHAGLVRLRHHF